MSNKLFQNLKEKLNTNHALKEDLGKVYNKKFVLTFNFVSLLLFIVIIYNSISSALLGLPPINIIATINNGGPVLQLLERLALGIIAIVTTIPFFIMLAMDKLGKYKSINEVDKRQKEINESSSITNTMYIIRAIFLIAAIIAVSYFVTPIAILQPSFILIALAAVFATYVLYKITHQIVISYYLGESDVGNINSVVQSVSPNILNQSMQHLRDNEKTIENNNIENPNQLKTKSLIEESIAKMSYVNFSEISNEDAYKCLLTNLYEAQLTRVILAKAQKEDITELKFSAYSNEETQTLHNNISQLDSQIENSPLFKNYSELMETNITSFPEVIKAKHAFRNNMLSYQDKEKMFEVFKRKSCEEIFEEEGCEKIFQEIFEEIFERENCKETFEEIFKMNNIQHDDVIKAAIIAEIQQEMLLIDHDLSTETKTKLLQERLKNRDQLDTAIAKSLQIELKNPNMANDIGFVIGNINALINGVITAAVTSNILANILPNLLLGFAISNPLVLYIVMGIAFISGWYASYSITQEAITNVCNRVSNTLYKRKVLGSDKHNFNNLSYMINSIICLAIVGVGILTGIQVFHMLVVLGPMVAIISSAFIAAMTIMAGGSLFSKFIDDTFETKKQKQLFLETYFPNDKKQQNNVNYIENICYLISIALGILATILLWHSMHIFAFSVLSGMLTFLVAEIIATVIVNVYCPEKSAPLDHIQREICGKISIFATALCSMCFFMSTFISITALVAGNIGVVLAIVTALCIALLYSQFVWTAGASPDKYWQKSLPSIRNDLDTPEPASNVNKVKAQKAKTPSGQGLIVNLLEYFQSNK